MEKDEMDILSALAHSDKVRISPTDLENLVTNSDSITLLIFLLSNRYDFIRQVKGNFPFWAVTEDDLDPEKVLNLVPHSVMVCKDEVPGPMAFANIPWKSVIELISWPSVLQVEKSQIYTGKKDA